MANKNSTLNEAQFHPLPSREEFAFRFDPSDLYTNQKGRLTESQQARLWRNYRHQLALYTFFYGGTIILLVFALIRKFQRGETRPATLFAGLSALSVYLVLRYGVRHSLQIVRQDAAEGQVERRWGVLHKSDDGNTIYVDSEEFKDFFGKFKSIESGASYNVYIAPRTKILFSVEKRDASEWELTHNITTEDLEANRLGQASIRQARDWYAQAKDSEITWVFILGMGCYLLLLVFVGEELLAQSDELWLFGLVKIVSLWTPLLLFTQYFARKRRQVRKKYDPSRGTVHHFDFQKRHLVRQPNDLGDVALSDFVYGIERHGRSFELFYPAKYDLLEEAITYRLYYVIYADDVDHDMLSFEPLEGD